MTLLVGVEEDEVKRALEIINAHAGPEVVEPAPESHPPHRLTIFVLDVRSMARY